MGRLASGVTLVELLVSLVLVVILLMIAIPSYQSITTSSRMTSEINGLVTHLQFARSEAVKRGESVTVTSNNGINWEGGWTVIVNDPTVINPVKQQAAFQGTDTLTSTANAFGAIAYDRNGFTTNATTLSLHDQANTLDLRRCIVVSGVGQMSLKTQGACP
jgi:type IV fimbrial biogenesis protein FimT